MAPVRKGLEVKTPDRETWNWISLRKNLEIKMHQKKGIELISPEEGSGGRGYTN